jgi:UDP-3-O-acyl-N-acetylglucosamine deacetylase
MGPRQTTLGAAVELAGVGLHGGRPCRMTLAPAPADTGIVWQRVDLPGRPAVPAAVEYVINTERATSIGRGEAIIRTVEHVMAALAAMGVDNALVQLDGEEPPFADGAAAEFVRLIQQAGVVELDAPRRVRVLTAPVWVGRRRFHRSLTRAALSHQLHLRHGPSGVGHPVRRFRHRCGHVRP